VVRDELLGFWAESQVREEHIALLREEEAGEREVNACP